MQHFICVCVSLYLYTAPFIFTLFKKCPRRCPSGAEVSIPPRCVGGSLFSEMSPGFLVCSHLDGHSWQWCAVIPGCVCVDGIPVIQPREAVFPGYKNTEVSCHFILQGIFPTQRSNLHVSCVSCIGRWILLPLSHLLLCLILPALS